MSTQNDPQGDGDYDRKDPVPLQIDRIREGTSLEYTNEYQCAAKPLHIEGKLLPNMIGDVFTEDLQRPEVKHQEHE
jgi:hypothetical protein